MHSCKREEMPMFGQSRTELPAAASEHHDQDHPHPITSVSSSMKCMLYMYVHVLQARMLHWTTDLNLTFSISWFEKNQETHGMEVLHQPNDRPLTAGNHQNATSPYIHGFTDSIFSTASPFMASLFMLCKWLSWVAHDIQWYSPNLNLWNIMMQILIPRVLPAICSTMASRS